MAAVRFIAAVCLHRQDDNLFAVVDKACQSSCQPFRDVVSEVPQTPANHLSPFLFTWANRACPEDLDRPARISAWGQVPLLARDSRGSFFSASPSLEFRATTSS